MNPRKLLTDFAHATTTPLVIGHRGCSSRAPENTMAAFALIKEHGIRGVELDVHRCATGEIVVAHDDTLERTAGVPLRITHTSLAELREHDVGAWFGPEFAGERLPLLEEVFELLGGHCFFDVEIKHYRTHIGRARAGSVEAETVRLIRRHGLAGRCFVSSFDPFVVRRARLLAREIPVAAIYASARDVPWFLRRSGGRAISHATIMKPNYADATSSHVRGHHRMGRLVMPWTVDDEQTAILLAQRGVDAVITNRPVEIREAIAGRAGAGA
ncbi:MAG: glycerophosphodiester phosphodiesterase [Spirochaetota bacterium]